MLALPFSADEFSLTASDLASTTVLLNSTELKAEPDGSEGSLKADAVKKGPVRLPASSVTFLTISTAHNKSCM